MTQKFLKPAVAKKLWRGMLLLLVSSVIPIATSPVLRSVGQVRANNDEKSVDFSDIADMGEDGQEATKKRFDSLQVSGTLAVGGLASINALNVKNGASFGGDVAVDGNLFVDGALIAQSTGLRSYGQFFNYTAIANDDAMQTTTGAPIPWTLFDGSSGASPNNSSNFSLDTTTGIITIANPGIYFLIFAARFKYPEGASISEGGTGAQGEALIMLNGAPLNYRITTGEVSIAQSVLATLYAEPTNTNIIQTTSPNAQLTINITLENDGVTFTSPAHTYHSNAFLTIAQLN